jgi:integral membrane protein
VKPSSAALLFRAVALAEACSWVGLLFGMFVKYVLATSEAGVKLFGPIHGGIFVLYVLVTLVVWKQLRWDRGTALLALAASVPPLATLWFDRRATRSGALPLPEPVPTA